MYSTSIYVQYQLKFVRGGYVAILFGISFFARSRYKIFGIVNIDKARGVSPQGTNPRDYCCRP